MTRAVKGMETPKYSRLADDLRADILAGKYTQGERFPSDNELVAGTGYSRQTVRKAVSMLEGEGFLHRVRGSGTYISSPAAGRGRTYNIGVVTTYIGEYIFPLILQGIEEVLRERGYTSMLQATHNRTAEERRILSEFLTKPIDGLIVEGTKTALPNQNLDLYETLSRMGIPVVFINGYYPGLHRPVYVVADDRGGGLTACNYLLDRGHSRVAGIFKSDDIQGHRRYEGYARALLDRDLPVDDSRVFWYTTETREVVLEAAAGVLADRCTAVVCYNDEVALHLAQAMAARPPRMPRLEMASFDNSTYAALSPVPFVSLDSPKAEIGRQAARRLLERIERGTGGSVVLPWTL